MPTVGVGRLVDTPDADPRDDRSASSRPRACSTADSTLTGGYGAWAELPGTRHREPRTGGRRPSTPTLGDPTPDDWGKTDVESALFPAGGQSPRVVSINTHADETRMLPGVDGAEDGRFADADLLHAGGATSTRRSSPDRCSS